MESPAGCDLDLRLLSVLGSVRSDARSPVRSLFVGSGHLIGRLELEPPKTPRGEC